MLHTVRRYAACALYVTAGFVFAAGCAFGWYMFDVYNVPVLDANIVPAASAALASMLGFGAATLESFNA